jgi:menaquinone-dependent protoporphyrinogen oxidase
MATRVLVAYVTRTGSTQEIAEAVAQALREREFEVDLQVIKKVRGLEGYQAVVLGAPLYMFHWHKDALHFLEKQRKAFGAGLPLAIFAGGPIGDTDENGWQEARRQLDQELVKLPWLKPVSIEIVGGKYDAEKLSFPMSLLPALRNMPPSDLRDWDAIRRWAESLAPLLAA